MKSKTFIFILLYLIMAFVTKTYSQEVYKNPSVPLEERVKDLLGRMTFEEKLGQMQQVSLDQDISEALKAAKQGKLGSAFNVTDPKLKERLQKTAVEESRLKIPLIFGQDVIHGFKTIFPIPLGQAATWNPEIVKTGARIAATEAAEAGIDWTFAPMVDISRDPRWGRIAESCGEDPLLAARMGAAMVKGFQGDDLKAPGSIAACAKHYVGYGAAEGGRDYNTTYIPERLLRDVYLVPFKGCVDAGAQTLMSAFNDINGIPASGNEFTLRQVLRNEWKFDGFVVSDWTSISEMIPHGFAKDGKEAALKGLKAGVNMEMVSTHYADNFKTLLDEGRINIEMIDEMVSGILKVKFRLGLFEDPYREKKLTAKTLSQEFLDAAMKSAEESAVLLQNEGNLLPLSAGIKTLAVIGPLADDPKSQIGCWAGIGKAENSVTPLSAIREMLGNSIKILYEKGMENCRTNSKTGFMTAVNAAKQADAVLIFAGEDDLLTGEAHSRAFLDLPGVQEDLINAVSQTGKPVALIIMAGRSLTFEKIKGDVKSILYAWHPGTMGGPALANILLGKISPSGKLPVTFPRTVGQVPIYYNHKSTGRPPSEKERGIKMGTPENPIGYVSYYLDVDFTPEYPFGYGLSYSKFRYSDLRLSNTEMKTDGSIEVSVRVKNTGDFDASEVVQLYTQDLFGSVTRPVKELKNFSKIFLKKGEEKDVKFTLQASELRFYDKDMKFTVEPGDFKLWAGTSSQEGLEATFKVVE